jgi:hypothetical protein
MKDGQSMSAVEMLTETEVVVRDVLPDDAHAIAAIYAWHVLNGRASFEEVPPTVDEMRQRIESVTKDGLPWLVALYRGWKGPILLLEGFFHADELPLLDKYRLTTTIHSNWQVKALQNAKLHAPLDIYVKVNSGMNRLGFQPERVHSVWQQLRAIPNVGEMTLMAHFADAD